MTERKLICVACPRGCPVTVTMDDNGEIIKVEGNTCPRGDTYARAEVTHPERSLTSTVRVTGGKHYVVPCKSSTAIPKELLFDAMVEINKASIAAPVHIGDVIIENLLGTGADIVATNEID